MLFVEECEAFSIQREDDGFIGMAMTEFVRAYRKVGHVRFEDGVAAHLPKHAGVALAALFPGDHFRGSDIAYEVGVVPALLDTLALREIVGAAVVALAEGESCVIDQAEASKHLHHEWEGCDGEQAGGMLGIGIGMP